MKKTMLLRSVELFFVILFASNSRINALANNHLKIRTLYGSTTTCNYNVYIHNNGPDIFPNEWAQG